MATVFQNERQAVITSVGPLSAKHWRDYLDKNWTTLTEGLTFFKVVVVAGVHGGNDGSIGGDAKNVITCEKQVAILKERKSDVEFEINVLDLKGFICDDGTVDESAITTKLDAFGAHVILFSICFSQVSKLKSILEKSGLLPGLRLERELVIATRGRVLSLDESQRRFIELIADPSNKGKSVVIHGPEGSGKTLLGTEAVKVMIHQHYDEMKLTPDEGKKQIRVIFAACFKGKEGVELLKRQMEEDLSEDLQAICKTEFKKIESKSVQNPKEFNSLENIIQGLIQQDDQREGVKGGKTIVMVDELEPEFETSDWKVYEPLKDVQVVFCLKHAFHDAKIKNTRTLKRRPQSVFVPTEDKIHDDFMSDNANVIIGKLLKAYRCSNQIRRFVYYMLIHSPTRDRLYEEKSFSHDNHSFDSKNLPIWMEVKNEKAFMQYAESEKLFQDSKDVMLVYDSDISIQSFKSIEQYCNDKGWRCFKENEIYGSEASTVIIYNLEQFHFEAFTRAINNLILVTTTSEGGPLKKALAELKNGHHDDELCKTNCIQNGKFFKQHPFSCPFQEDKANCNTLMQKYTDMRSMVVLGSTGAGKSTLCNVISGENDSILFPVSKNMDSCTEKTLVKQVKWRGNEGFPLTLIDTPGLNDSKGGNDCMDSFIIAEMCEELKKMEYINTFLIVFNGANPRFDDSLKAMIQIFISMFGKDFLENNTVFEFSNWAHDKASIKRRGKEEKDEEHWSNELNKQLNQLFNCNSTVPAVFIDSKYDEDEEGEVEKFNSEMEKLENHFKTMPMYPCEGFEALKTKLDKAEQEKERLYVIKEKQQKDIDNLQEQNLIAEFAKTRLEKEAKRKEEEVLRLQVINQNKEKEVSQLLNEKEQKEKVMEKLRETNAKVEADKACLLQDKAKQDKALSKLELEKHQKDKQVADLQLTNQQNEQTNKKLKQDKDFIEKEKARLSVLNASHQVENDRLRKEKGAIEEEKVKLSSDHEKEKSRLMEKGRKHIKAMEEENERLQDGFRREMKQLVDANELERAKLKEENVRERHLMQEENRKVRDSNQREKEKLLADNEREKSELIADSKKEIAKLKSATEKELIDLKKEKDELQKEKMKVQEDMEKQMTKMQEEIGKEKNLLQEQLMQEKLRLEEDMDNQINKIHQDKGFEISLLKNAVSQQTMQVKELQKEKDQIENTNQKERELLESQLQKKFELEKTNFQHQIEEQLYRKMSEKDDELAMHKNYIDEQLKAIKEEKDRADRAEQLRIMQVNKLQTNKTKVQEESNQAISAMQDKVKALEQQIQSTSYEKNNLQQFINQERSRVNQIMQENYQNQTLKEKSDKEKADLGRQLQILAEQMKNLEDERKRRKYEEEGKDDQIARLHREIETNRREAKRNKQEIERLEVLGNQLAQQQRQVQPAQSQKPATTDIYLFYDPQELQRQQAAERQQAAAQQSTSQIVYYQQPSQPYCPQHNPRAPRQQTRQVQDPFSTSAFFTDDDTEFINNFFQRHYQN